MDSRGFGGVDSVMTGFLALVIAIQQAGRTLIPPATASLSRCWAIASAASRASNSMTRAMSEEDGDTNRVPMYDHCRSSTIANGFFLHPGGFFPGMVATPSVVACRQRNLPQ